ncbi:hypothetical protein WOLCODRAFT_162995 [Wolfiporia cocos MD-104 SS10]|uniref:Nucleoside transporter n=1 Tax=Wolfiporia cocos (strain MD-104) TaxID=742152 RepID=A0A2H3JYV7_WOLCO|nr:hypothetical protein WOLCODRAFT_162995 [Wolfiporia cocos MD-104 SS10]
MAGHPPSSSEHTSEAVYHPIPQAPVASGTPLDLYNEEDRGDLDNNVPSVPQVQNSRIRWIHFVLGCAVLLPWNVMITATPYFLSRLDGSPFRSSFSSYMSTTFTIVNFGVLAHATATSKQSLHAYRVRSSLMVLACLTALLTVSTWIHVSPGLFVAFVLITAVGQAAAGSYLQTAVIAVASLFGHSAMQAAMSGQAAVGVAISGVQVLSAAASIHMASYGNAVSVADPASRAPEERSAALFFGLSTIFLVATQIVHAWMMTLPAYKMVVSRPVPEPSVSMLDSTDETRSLTSGEPLRKNISGKDRILRLTRINLPYNFAVAYVFAITLSVFPPITVSIQSTSPITHPLLFSAIHFLVYNVGDFGGRLLCSLPHLMVWSAKRLLTLSLARTLFIPLFLMCNVQWSHPAPMGPIITSDTLFMLILLLFGISNGYVSSMCMMAAPSLAHNPRLRGRVADVDIAATVASFCLVGGLTFGSMLSFAVRAAVCTCNPFRE